LLSGSSKTKPTIPIKQLSFNCYRSKLKGASSIQKEKEKAEKDDTKRNLLGR
jgi:hypothetical protein